MHFYNVLNVSFTVHLHAIIMQLSNNSRIVYLNGLKVTAVQFLILRRPVSKTVVPSKDNFKKIQILTQSQKESGLEREIHSWCSAEPAKILSSLISDFANNLYREYAAAQQKY